MPAELPLPPLHELPSLFYTLRWKNCWGIRTMISSVRPMFRRSLSQTAGWKRWENVLARHGRSFWLASRLLPETVREPASILYAFFRHLDDIADKTGYPEEAARQLAAWRTWIVSGFRMPPPQPELATAVADVFRRYHLDPQFTLDLLSGLEDDVAQRRIETRQDLLNYCYQVGGTVGLTLALILGVSCTAGLAAARSLGIAMQLTNVVRDLGEDLRMGRLYLPREDIHRFGLREEQLFELAQRRTRPTPELQALLRLMVTRARSYYHFASDGFACLPDTVRFGIVAAAELYAGILRVVEHNEYDTLRLRAVVSSDEKLLAVLRAWHLDRRFRRRKVTRCRTCG